MNISEVKTVQIRSFSRKVTLQNITTCAGLKIRRNNCIVQAFEVDIFLTSSYKDSICVRIDEKWLKPNKAPVEDNLTWTFSVVDVHGDCKYSQSFIVTNSAFYGYSMLIPNIFNSSVLLEQSDVLLPEDELTLKIALTCPFYRGPLTRKANTTNTQLFRSADPTGTSIKSHLNCLESAVHTYSKSIGMHFNDKKTELY
ncbi:hypothetical protein TNCT_585621 [Trichonephila clavata]|uniref:Uncharacterized protein n=1 Tax=Trichonephila clavata TaxID=2740835 RepID=A0A8X6JCA9_TRICU|nr:hypothetical protein TNCT_585621 [Trichonephila clavata]